MIFKVNIYASDKSLKDGIVDATVTFDTITKDNNLLNGKTFIAGSDIALVKELTKIINKNPDNIDIGYAPFFQRYPIVNPGNWFWVIGILYTVGWSNEFPWRVQLINGPSDEVVNSVMNVRNEVGVVY
jgi:hypothetical protein